MRTECCCLMESGRCLDCPLTVPLRPYWVTYPSTTPDVPTFHGPAFPCAQCAVKDEQLRAADTKLAELEAKYEKESCAWLEDATRLEQLEAENAELRADAERYRWLRDDAPGHWDVCRTADNGDTELLLVPGVLDAAIDAAIRARGMGEGKG